MKIENICKKVLKDLKSIDKTNVEYQNKYINLYQTVNQLYPQEVNQLFETIGVSEDLQMVKENAATLIDSIDAFGIDFKNKRVIVKLGEENIDVPVKDVASFIKETFDLTEDDWRYHLVLSCYIQLVNFERFQLVHAVILS